MSDETCKFFGYTAMGSESVYISNCSKCWKPWMAKAQVHEQDLEFISRENKTKQFLGKNSPINFEWFLNCVA